jgi:tetratricopeptide (TPR) repeat protein
MNELNVWKVELKGVQPAETHQYIADLCNVSFQKVSSAELTADESFEFRNVPYGTYWVVVHDLRGNLITRELLSARADSWGMSIRLPEHRTEEAPAGGISVNELQHPPSRKAVKDVIAATKLQHAGDYPAAIERLQDAIRVSPEFPAAHTNLAAVYAMTGRYTESLTESQRALALGHPNPVDFCNIAYAQTFLKRYGEAADNARQCLSLAPDSAQAHYILGCLLARDRRTIPQALDHLERAVSAYPSLRQQMEALRREMNRPAMIAASDTATATGATQ